MKDIHKHFSRIASEYKNLRMLDFEPVSFISKQLNGMPEIQGLDVGCGTGRYDLRKDTFVELPVSLIGGEKWREKFQSHSQMAD